MFPSRLPFTSRTKAFDVMRKRLLYLAKVGIGKDVFELVIWLKDFYLPLCLKHPLLACPAGVWALKQTSCASAQESHKDRLILDEDGMIYRLLFSQDRLYSKFNRILNTITIILNSLMRGICKFVSRNKVC